jgi:hypothetical protein
MNDIALVPEKSSSANWIIRHLRQVKLYLQRALSECASRLMIPNMEGTTREFGIALTLDIDRRGIS